MNRKPVIVIGGPTASGKSSIALQIAKRFNGAVVNADSMQIYRDLQILTARPDADSVNQAPHHLYGILGTNERCSAGQWRDRAMRKIAEIGDEGLLPVVVGGTGLYLRALMTGLHRIPAVPDAVRAALNARLNEQGAASLHAELTASDPESARAINPADSQRVVRALEVLLHTGRGLKRWQSEESEEASSGVRFLTLVTLPPREYLYDVANVRFDRMIAGGAIDEVERLFSLNPPDDFPLRKAVGVQPIRSYLAGAIDIDGLKETGRRDTRRYAKRQMTWFRHQIIPDYVLQTKYSEIKLEKIFSQISTFLLTE